MPKCKALAVAGSLLFAPAALAQWNSPANVGYQNPALIYAAQYLPPAYSFGTLNAGNPTTFANLGISLATAQAKYGSGLVTATTQYVDEVVAQYSLSLAATLYTTQGRTCAVLPPASLYLDNQISYDGSKVCLIGGGNTFGNTTTLFTQTVNALTASATGTGSGTNLTISGTVTGAFKPGQILSGTNVPAGTVIVSQTSGTTGGTGVYVTSLATTASGTTVTANMAAVYIFSGAAASAVGNTVIRGITWAGLNAGKAAFSTTSAGVAIASGTGFWNAGSIALQIGNLSEGVARDLFFWNYDIPHSWATGNVYVWDFLNVNYSSNNKGPTISAAIPNSFERMHWSGGDWANNNYGFYFATGAIAGSLFVDNVSLDYNIVNEGYYDGLSAGNSCQIPLFISAAHIETGSATSGTSTTRFNNNGCLTITGSIGYESGSYPVGWIGPSFFGRTTLNGNTLPGQGGTGTFVPAVYSSGTTGLSPSGAGNQTAFGGDVLLFRSQNGDMMGGPTTSPSQTYATSFSVGLFDQLSLHLLNTGGTITVPPDATVNQAIGTVLLFETTDTNTWTISCAGPPACSGTLTGIGGAIGTKFSLTKTAGNAWTR